MLRHVSGDLYQIGESVSGHDGWHEAVRIYVLLNDGCPLVFDAGSHIHSAQIMADLSELLGDIPPAYVFLTHTELPHTGNLSSILQKWPDTKLVVSSGILPHVEMPWWIDKDIISYGYAGTHEIYGGRAISFLDGILKDQPGTHWMYDEVTGTLFTADAMGYLYPSSADLLFDDELDNGIEMSWMSRYHESAFRFLPYVVYDKMMADFAKLYHKRDIKIMAPTHGNAIRGDIAAFKTQFADVMKGLCR